MSASPLMMAYHLLTIVFPPSFSHSRHAGHFGCHIFSLDILTPLISAFHIWLRWFRLLHYAWLRYCRYIVSSPRRRFTAFTRAIIPMPPFYDTTIFQSQKRCYLRLPLLLDFDADIWRIVDFHTSCLICRHCIAVVTSYSIIITLLWRHRCHYFSENDILMLKYLLKVCHYYCRWCHDCCLRCQPLDVIIYFTFRYISLLFVIFSADYAITLLMLLSHYFAIDCADAAFFAVYDIFLIDVRCHWLRILLGFVADIVRFDMLAADDYAVISYAATVISPPLLLQRCCRFFSLLRHIDYFQKTPPDYDIFADAGLLCRLLPLHAAPPLPLGYWFRHTAYLLLRCIRATLASSITVIVVSPPRMATPDGHTFSACCRHTPLRYLSLLSLRLGYCHRLICYYWQHAVGAMMPLRRHAKRLDAAAIVRFRLVFASLYASSRLNITATIIFSRHCHTSIGKKSHYASAVLRCRLLLLS